MDITNTIFGQNRADSNNSSFSSAGDVVNDARICQLGTITDNAGNTGAAITTWETLNVQQTRSWPTTKVGLAVRRNQGVSIDYQPLC